MLSSLSVSICRSRIHNRPLIPDVTPVLLRYCSGGRIWPAFEILTEIDEGVCRARSSSAIGLTLSRAASARQALDTTPRGLPRNDYLNLVRDASLEAQEEPKTLLGRPADGLTVDHWEIALEHTTAYTVPWHTI